MWKVKIKQAVTKQKTRRILSKIADFSVVFSMVLIFFAFSLFNKNFISLQNIQNILSGAAPLLFMAMGLTFVLITGSIDLSTGAVCSCTCVITGLYIGDVGNKIFLFILVIGILAGLLNGMLVTLLKMPAFIVTLCTTSIWQCVALVLSKGASKSIPIDSWHVIEWAKIKIFGIPTLFVVSALIWLVFVFVEKCTVMGKSIFAVGANEQAARMMGLNSNQARITAFLLSGVGSALAGACYALRLKSSAPTIGSNLNLLAVAAVVLGGTWLSGGKGSVLRTLPSVITVIMLQSALKVVGLDAYYQEIIFGTILIIAIYLNSDKSRSKDVIIK